ncbi:hypothetical protein BDF14DRAFT_1782486 [Spinellus fusiger]|nr:hypothetical protein BDF14DRAFT_1782486 [Spinellus fusiger]
MDLSWDINSAAKHKYKKNNSPNNTPRVDNSRLTVEEGQPSAGAYSPADRHPLLRRPRADTMPAQPSFPFTPLFSSLAPTSRHRSGSVNIPSDSPENTNLDYSAMEETDSAIASTLASLGLDEGEDPIERSTPGTGFPPPGLSLPHTPFYSADSPHATRNRAYTVATRAPLDRPDLNRIVPGISFSPFSAQTLTTVQTRPRAISVGMSDGHISFSPFDETAFQSMPRFQPQVVVSDPVERGLRTTYSSGNLFDLNRDMAYVLGTSRRSSRRIASHEQLDRLPEAIDSNDSSANDFYGTADNALWSGIDSSSTGTQIPSRALWLGNINPSLSVPDLIQLFSRYGTVESARILSDKECAFVNFNTVESALEAKVDLETRLGNKVAGTPVRVGFGKADVNIAMALTNEAGPNAQGPTRALWVGNIPASINPALLKALFQNYGPIESVRVLSHKNCGFVNFEHQEDAVRARKILQNKEVLGPGTGPVRIGFAKVPATPEENLGDEILAPSMATSATPVVVKTGVPNNYQATQWATAMMMTSMMMKASGQQQSLSSSQPTSLCTAIAAERRFIMQQLGLNLPVEEEKEERVPISYCSVIPILPEIGVDRQLEPLRLREMRKGLDSGQVLAEVEDMAMECMDEIVELCSDYVGNTVIQKLFEYCNEATKETMLMNIAPYLASIGVHKNGTWAAQKIIDYAYTETQVHIVRTHIAPYVPLLLLDQFGNYVVQCSLRMGPERNQYIFDAIVDKCWEIGQGRFGARAVRAILDNPCVTKEQQVYAAAAIVQNAVLLTTNTNGALLLLWLLDTSELPGRYRVLCPRLLPYLTKLCTHKLGSMTVFKVISQRQEPDASQLLLNAIFNDPVLLDDVLKDQMHGVGLVQKIIGLSHLDKRQQIVSQVKEALTVRLKVQSTQVYRRLFEDLEQEVPQETAEDREAATVEELEAEQKRIEWLQNPQAVAMMANMYAAAMTAAAVTLNSPPPLPAQSAMAESSDLPDMAHFDQLIKNLLQGESPSPSTSTASASASASATVTFHADSGEEVDTPKEEEETRHT